MLERAPLFPHVIELNHQARRHITCSAYLIYDDQEWTLFDIGYEDAVDDCIELIRNLDFPFSQCKTLIASHADVDHIQGLSKAKQILKTTVTAHPLAAKYLQSGDKLATFAEITAQDIHYEMPPVEVENLVNDGDTIQVGSLELEVWHTPGHTDGQLSLRMGNLLFSGDNIFRDGCVGAIDAHHGSNIPDFITSLRRIQSRVAPPQPRPRLPQRRRPHPAHDRPLGNLPPHGRLRHLRDRLASDGPMGTRIGRRQTAHVGATYENRIVSADGHIAS